MIWMPFLGSSSLDWLLVGVWSRGLLSKITYVSVTFESKFGGLFYFLEENCCRF